jgi:hypothetical protein
MGFEEVRRCVLGLYWLQKPLDAMWRRFLQATEELVV